MKRNSIFEKRKARLNSAKPPESGCIYAIYSDYIQVRRNIKETQMDNNVIFLQKYYSNKFNTDNIDIKINDNEIIVKHNGRESIRVLIKCITENNEFISWVERSNYFVYKYYIYSKYDGNIWCDKLPGECDEDKELNFIVHKYIGNYYFMVYQGDWYHYHICAIINRTLKYIRVHGEALTIFEDYLIFEDYGSEIVYKFSIPELEMIKIFSPKEAKELDIKPSNEIDWNINYNYHFIDKK